MLISKIPSWIVGLILLAVLAVLILVDGPWRIPPDADLSDCKIVSCETFP